MMHLFKKAVRTPLYLTNTLSGVTEEFRKKDSGPVTLYSCGPTVYGPQHIGNLRAAVFSDTVARALLSCGYRVKRVINITDVGHLVGDGDEGEDKMAVGAAREKTTPEAIAERYTKQYLHDIEALNLPLTAITFPRATAYIKEQIAMIRALEQKSLTYKTSDGVYFDTEKFGTYGELGNIHNVSLQAGTRVSLGEKKNEHDFVLWRNAKENDLQQWDSPWGKGNPGWSIECSAMATTLLGPTIDIHTGGQDHIQVHHNNEIAQSEGATGKKPYVRYWMHNAFLTIGGEKISKSLGNTYTLDDVRARGIHPLALRYLFLQAQYRTPLSFIWESLAASEEALRRLWKTARIVRKESGGKAKPSKYDMQMKEVLANDLGTPQCIALLHTALGASLSPEEKWSALSVADELLGLSLIHPPEENLKLPEDVQKLIEKRKQARNDKDFAQSDALRSEIETLGYIVKDTPEGQQVSKK